MYCTVPLGPVMLHVHEEEINPLTPELNTSAQRCLNRFLLQILLLEPYISLIYARQTNKYTDYTREQEFCTWKFYCVSNVTFQAEFKYAIKIFQSPTVFVQ
jgi:hypothetical protein